METKYIILEDGICYDWDDYGVWGAVLYDITEKRIFTTNYGHGEDMSQRAESKELEPALKAGIVTEQEIKDALISKGDFNKDLVYDLPSSIKLNIPCKVSNRSRYVKGDAILLNILREPDNYRGGYITKLLVYSPSQNMVANVGYGTVTISDDVWHKVSEKAHEAMREKTTIGYLTHMRAYSMSYAACDSRNFHDCIVKNLSLAFPFMDAPDTSTAKSPQMEAQEAKAAAKKAAKMPELIEWAKGKLPEGTAEEVNALAEKVWKRYYA